MKPVIVKTHRRNRKRPIKAKKDEFGAERKLMADWLKDAKRSTEIVLDSDDDGDIQIIEQNAKSENSGILQPPEQTQQNDIKQAVKMPPTEGPNPRNTQPKLIKPTQKYKGEENTEQPKKRAQKKGAKRVVNVEQKEKDREKVAFLELVVRYKDVVYHHKYDCRCKKCLEVERGGPIIAAVVRVEGNSIDGISNSAFKKSVISKLMAVGTRSSVAEEAVYRVTINKEDQPPFALVDFKNANQARLAVEQFGKQWSMVNDKPHQLHLFKDRDGNNLVPPESSDDEEQEWTEENENDEHSEDHTYVDSDEESDEVEDEDELAHMEIAKENSSAEEDEYDKPGNKKRKVLKTKTHRKASNSTPKNKRKGKQDQEEDNKENIPVAGCSKDADQPSGNKQRKFGTIAGNEVVTNQWMAGTTYEELRKKGRFGDA